MKLLPVPLPPVSLPPPGQPSSHPSTPTLLHPHQSQLQSHHHVHHQQQHVGAPYSPSAADFSFWRYPSSQLSAYAAAAAANSTSTGAAGVPLIAPVPALSGLGGPAGVTSTGGAPLPSPLGIDPRLWGREDVAAFLRWCEREFDLREFDMDAFQMNGKAMCLLTKNDLSERCPGAGDVLYNALQMLVRDATLLQRCLPGSPVTPTSRHHTWPHLLATAQDAALHGHLAAAAHFASQQHAAAAAAAASVALSPAPSLDSQQGSPQHADQQQQQQQQQIQQQHTNGSSIAPITHHQQQGSVPAVPAQAIAASMYQSNGRSDSEDDECQDTKTALSLNNGVSPPGTPGLPPPSGYMTFSMQQAPPRSPVELKSPAPFRVSSGHGEFFQNEPSEPNTNGRLLWDFLQQLLNDSSQRYTNYIAWKNIETGVFKIVDPAGLAKLWGIQKNHLSMNYDKMSRALRYYYRVNILRKVQGERHCYQFLRNPSELKNIKNISLLRQQMSPTRVNSATPVTQQQPVVHPSVQSHQLTVPTSVSRSSPNVNALSYSPAEIPATVKTEPRVDDIDVENQSMEDEMPTDLSMMSNNSEMRATDLSSKFNGHRINVNINGNLPTYEGFKVDSDSK